MIKCDALRNRTLVDDVEFPAFIEELAHDRWTVPGLPPMERQQPFSVIDRLLINHSRI